MPSDVEVVIHSTSSSTSRSTEKTRFGGNAAEMRDGSGAATVRLECCAVLGMKSLSKNSRSMPMLRLGSSADNSRRLGRRKVMRYLSSIASAILGLDFSTTNTLVERRAAHAWDARGFDDLETKLRKSFQQRASWTPPDVCGCDRTRLRLSKYTHTHFVQTHQIKHRRIPHHAR